MPVPNGWPNSPEPRRNCEGKIISREDAIAFLVKTFGSYRKGEWICPYCWSKHETAPVQDMIPCGDFPETIFCPHCDFSVDLKEITNACCQRKTENCDGDSEARAGQVVQA